MFRPKNKESIRNVRPFDPARLYELEDLGLFLANDDSIRLKGQPEARYHYKIAHATDTLSRSAAELYNDSLWFALSKTLSILVAARLRDLGLFHVRLPSRCVECDTLPHSTIFSTAQAAEQTRTLVVFTDGILDITSRAHTDNDTTGGELGVWTGRLVSKTSISEGSLQDLTRLFKTQDRAIVLGNLSQIHWHKGLKAALTYHQFICAGGYRIDNSTVIPGSESSEAHVATVLEMNRARTGPISLIVTGASAYAIIAFLNSRWLDFEHKVVCLVGIAACFSESDISEGGFREFLSTVEVLEQGGDVC